jgi:hypothetical protein
MRLTIRIIPLLLLLAACTLKVPSVEEQQELVRRRTFPGGVPAWFAAGAGGNAQIASGGFMPAMLSAPPAIQARTEDVTYPVLVRADELKPQDVKTGAEQELSVLDRINRECPGNEKEINQALTNTNRSERISQYQTLTRKCPMSPDLLLWLADDYRKAGQFIDARTTYQQVLVLDPASEKAKEGIATVDQEMSR